MTVMLITGASRGIGAATARAAAAAGWDVAVNYRSERERAEELVRALSATGSRAVAVRGDVSHEAEVLAMFDAAESALGRVGCLVNNAGIAPGYGPFADLELADIEVRPVFRKRLLDPSDAGRAGHASDVQRARLRLRGRVGLGGHGRSGVGRRGGGHRVLLLLVGLSGCRAGLRPVPAGRSARAAADAVREPDAVGVAGVADELSDVVPDELLVDGGHGGLLRCGVGWCRGRWDAEPDEVADGYRRSV